MSSSDPDLPLWQQLQQGDDSALELLIKRHSEGLFRFIYGYAQNEQDARDILQETFVHAYFKRHQFQPKAQLSTWLYRIALNLCRDRARSRAHKENRRTDSLDLPREEIVSKNPSPRDQITTEEELKRLKSAIHSLPDELRTSFILAVLEEKPQEECAQILGISRKAVETRVYRARRILMEKLS